ncbi:hypothetical protein FOL47_006082, partial [Perkinsus chesapeaki]
LRGPPMGAPHAPFCLEDAMQRLRVLAKHKLPSWVLQLIESAIAAKSPLPVHYEPYMDDIICGATGTELLVLIIDALLLAADLRGFAAQPAKRQVGPPSEGSDPKHVLGCLWFSDDTIGPQAPPVTSLPTFVLLPDEYAVDTGCGQKSVCSTTRRDLLSVINSHYDPL